MTLDLTIQADVLKAALGVATIGIAVGLFYVWAKYMQRKEVGHD